MSTITNMKEFKTALDSLSDQQQRVLAAQFIIEVLDLTDDSRLRDIQAIAGNSNAKAEELVDAYSIARAISLDLSLHGDFELIDFKKQAAHFVAKACSACLVPLPLSMKEQHRAWNVAHYCREARICSEMEHEQDTEILTKVEKDLQRVIKKQYALTTEYLAEHGMH
jgi:Zn-finger protein